MSDGCNLPHVQAESTTLQAVDMAAFEHGEGAGITKYEKVFLSYATNILRGCPLMSFPVGGSRVANGVLVIPSENLHLSRCSNDSIKSVG